MPELGYRLILILRRHWIEATAAGFGCAACILVLETPVARSHALSPAVAAAAAGPDTRMAVRAVSTPLRDASLERAIASAFRACARFQCTIRSVSMDRTQASKADESIAVPQVFSISGVGAYLDVRGALGAMLTANSGLGLDQLEISRDGGVPGRIEFRTRWSLYPVESATDVGSKK